MSSNVMKVNGMDVYMRQVRCSYETQATIYFIIQKDDKYMDYKNVRYCNFDYLNRAIKINVTEGEFDFLFSHIRDYDLDKARYVFLHFNMLDNYKVDEVWTKACFLKPHLRETEFERKYPYPYALCLQRYQ